MAGGVRAGSFGVRHRAREVNTEVTVEVVGLVVVRGMRYVVRGTDVGGAVREGSPDQLRGPGLHVAKRLVHDRGVLRGGGLSVKVRVSGHPGQVPGQAGDRIKHGEDIAVAVLAAPVGAVREDLYWRVAL